MRANITYSVDVDNIPDEIIRIVDGETDNVSNNILSVRYALESKNYTKAREKIMEARQALGDADIRLFELDQIMASYIDMVNQGEQEEAPEEAPVEEEVEADESG